MISVGTLFDPVKAVTDLIIDGPAKAFETIQLNTTKGIGLPKPISDVLGIEDLVSGRLGLFPNAKFRYTFDLLNSEVDKTVAYTDITAKLPLSLDENMELSTVLYALKSGITTKLTAGLTALNASTKVDLLDETLAITASGPTSPKLVLTAGGNEIIKLPDILGSDLAKAITDLV